MQMVSEVMTRNVQFIAPQESLQRAAQMMNELNVGALPVCDNEKLVGMITDRDITVRSTASGRHPAKAHVDEIMSTDIRWCFEDQPLDEVMIQMAGSQIRRVPVVTHDDQHKLVGIVALGDVATKTVEDQKQDVEQVVEMVSSPSKPDGQHASGSADTGSIAEIGDKVIEDGAMGILNASSSTDGDDSAKSVSPG
jgi:CBS domain-containing protein